MVNTFAGDPTLVKSFNAKFDNAMALMPAPYTGAKIQDAIETVLSFFDVLDNDPSNLWMLSAIAVPPGDIRLVKTFGKVVTEIPGYDYVGIGDSSLLRYLGPLLTGIQGQQYVADQAVALGTYLVLKAKTYIEDCGGDTEVMIVRPNGHIEIRNGETYSIEQRVLWMEKEIKTVSSCFFDPRISDENFNKVLSVLVRKLTDDHSQMHNRPPWKP
jgi:hypothetical protein